MDQLISTYGSKDKTLEVLLQQLRSQKKHLATLNKLLHTTEAENRELKTKLEHSNRELSRARHHKKQLTRRLQDTEDRLVRRNRYIERLSTELEELDEEAEELRQLYIEKFIARDRQEADKSLRDARSL